ncbi:MAG: hypothetical protein MJZ11_07950 [Lachnospiraceae bacterium]|nr:hypothetical protein [Lachnospiraceae bacterium]
MKNLLLYIHQLPQNLIGLLVILFTGAKKNNCDGITYYKPKQFFGVSLGNYIILRVTSINDIHHEHGHQIQSRRLGWLYLLIIGLPSITFNIWDIIAHRKWSINDRIKWYYSLPWEADADKLGGVHR